MLNTFILGLASIGTITVLLFAYSIIQFLTFHFLTPSHPLKAYKRKSTPAYALITGSSAGIGLGIAQELIRQGFGVILLGHLPDELDEAAAELRKISPSALVRTLVLDARAATPEQLEEAVKSIADLEVSILVNNVGGNAIRKPEFRTHSTYSCADVDVVIDQNARFMARLTALMIPLLSRRNNAAPAERSLILNMSSGGMFGVPWLVMYAATKGFNWSFSVALARELKIDPATAHIDCLAILPGDVHSQGNSRGVPAHEPRWDDFGRNVVLKVDGAVKQGWLTMKPHWRHDLEIKALVALPEGPRTQGIMDVMVRKKDAWLDFYAKNR